MNKLLAVILVGAILIIGIFLWQKQYFTDKTIGTTGLMNQDPSPSSQPKDSQIPVSQNTDIQAYFTIVTGSITRSFKAEKYHNLSPDVYIENPDPNVVYVKKTGIKWSDFFHTLPMKLTKDCLTTGDGETYCDGKDGNLKFYLNDVETPNLLDMEIKEGARALIKFI